MQRVVTLLSLSKPPDWAIDMPQPTGLGYPALCCVVTWPVSDELAPMRSSGACRLRTRAPTSRTGLAAGHGVSSIAQARGRGVGVTMFPRSLRHSLQTDHELLNRYVFADL